MRDSIRPHCSVRPDGFTGRVPDYPVFDTDFGRIGIMICWDVQYPDPARALALRGAEVILMPIWDGDRLLAKARAIENHLFLVSSGYGFPAQVLDPLGAELASSEKNGTIVTVTVDLNRRYADEWLGELRGRFFREVRGDLQLEPAGRK
jgi:predicted amidohydrolase